MNHEEHVNQLKSEVRYIQEVVNICEGLWLACCCLNPWGLAVRVRGALLPPGTSRRVSCERAAMPAPAAALKPRLNPNHSGKLAAELNSPVC